MPAGPLGLDLVNRVNLDLDLALGLVNRVNLVGC